MSNDDALKEDLLAGHEEFRRLHEEHLECERRLEALVGHQNLAQDDESEQKRIKLRKLAIKDRAEQILREHRSSGVPA